MKNQRILRVVKFFGDSTKVEFPAPEISAAIIWIIVFSMINNKFYPIVAALISTLVAIPIFIAFKQYVKADTLKQKAINEDIINKFNLSKNEEVEVLITSMSTFELDILQYAVKTLINMHLIKFYAKISENDEVIVTIQNDEGKVISSKTYYNLMDFEQTYKPKKIA